MHLPVYVGNYEYDASERELERTFDKYGDVDRVEYKSATNTNSRGRVWAPPPINPPPQPSSSPKAPLLTLSQHDLIGRTLGFCFVHYKDKRDAEDAIHAMDGKEWGRLRRRLRVEFAKNDANVRERETKRRNSAEPSRTLFVAGFDPRTIRTRDIEKAFEAIGRLVRCEIKKTYSFVEFEKIEDAKEACEQLHGTRINGREITVEYVVNKGGVGGPGGGGFGGGGGGGGFGGGGFRSGGDRFDDRGGRGGGFGGGDRFRGRSRSRSGDRRRRSPSYDRSRSPRPARRSPSPMRRSSPSPERRRERTRSRSPYKAAKSRSPRRSPRRSPSRSRSPRG